MGSLNKELNCFGYYGFGGGYNIAKKKQYGLVYCNICSQSSECWQKHRERVDQLYPEVTKAFNCLVEQFGGNGQKAEEEWVKMYQTADPYILVFSGNMQDGGAIAAGKKPMERGAATLNYPFIVN
jgi:hypothetical protein